MCLLTEHATEFQLQGDRVEPQGQSVCAGGQTEGEPAGRDVYHDQTGESLGLLGGWGWVGGG